MAPAILFLLLAFATVFVTPVTLHFTKPATIGLTETLTDALNTIADDEHSDRRDRLFQSIADLISKSLESPALTNTLRESLISSLMHEGLHDAALNTLQRSMVLATENKSFQKTALEVVRVAFTSALNDQLFVRDLMSSVVGALVAASKDEELTQSLLDVITNAVSQALGESPTTYLGVHLGMLNCCALLPNYIIYLSPKLNR